VPLADHRLARLIAAAFFLSGLASLIEQVAWQRVLTLHVGVGAISTAIVVSLFMAGLGTGSLIGGYLAGRVQRLLRLFVWIELALAVAGAGSVPLLRSFTPGIAGWTAVGLGLWVPTLLMGMTLPLLTTVLAQRSGAFMRSVSRLYFMNTLGAASGALWAGYVLVSLVGLDGCIYVAAGIDAVLAAAVFAGTRGAEALRDDHPGAEVQRLCNERVLSDNDNERGWPVALVYTLVFVTGFIAIGYEIVWYRIIGVLVKDSPYAFATVLAVYLASLAVGGLLIDRYLSACPSRSRRDLYLLLQFCIGATVLATVAGFYVLAQHSPLQTLTGLSFSADLHPAFSWSARRFGSHTLAEVFLALDVFVWPTVFMCLPTLLTGASFPLIASLAYRQPGSEGSAVGTTCFFGVVGNALGGIVTGLVLLPAMGTEQLLLAFGCTGLLFGAGMSHVGAYRPTLVTRVVMVAALVSLSIAVCPRAGQLYAVMHVAPFEPHTRAFEEGRDAVVLTYADKDRLRNFVNGQGHGYRPGPFFLAEAIEALTSVRTPRRVLVIGFGAGSVTEAALLDERVEQVTIVELCESVIVNLRKFPMLLGSVLNDPRVGIVIGDGRRFLKQGAEPFDVILADPLRTTTAYSNNVHSRQFFALAKARLAPGGVLMVGGLDDGLTVPATLLSEFEHVRSFSSFCLASATPLLRDEQRFSRLTARLPIGIALGIEGFTTEYTEDAGLRAAVRGLPVNDDWRPVSEYYLGAPLASGGRR
jgi:spermidine synthase